MEDLPSKVRTRWINTAGTHRLSVYPAEDITDSRALRRFVESVQRVIPDATDEPVLSSRAGDAVVKAFQQAFSASLILITILLPLILRQVRGRGMMIGIELGMPERRALKTAWSMVYKMDASLFPQAVIIPLLDDHAMIAQVAGHHMDVIKLLPPLNLEREDADAFLTAFESVISGLERFPGPAWDLLMRLGKFALTPTPRRGAI